MQPSLEVKTTRKDHFYRHNHLIDWDLEVHTKSRMQQHRPCLQAAITNPSLGRGEEGLDVKFVKLVKDQTVENARFALTWLNLVDLVRINIYLNKVFIFITNFFNAF